MSKTVKKEIGKEPDYITIDTDDEDEGYVTIQYEQPNIPALKIPTEINGDLPWETVQALDSSIIHLIVQSKEERRVLKLKNGIINEPKRGWTTCNIFAIVKKNSESNVQEAIRSTTSSQLSSISLKNEDTANVVSSVKKRNISIESSIIADVSRELPVSNLTSRIPVEICSKNPETSLSNKENSDSTASISSKSNKQHLSDSDVFAAYKVSNLHELKRLLKKRCDFSNDTLDLILQYFKRTFMMHDKKVIEIIDCAKYTNIFYNKLDPSASDFCDLCLQSLTVKHLLSKNHLNKYESKYHREIPEISIILQPENRIKFFKSFAKRLQESPQFSITSRTVYLSPYKDAFIHRITRKSLTFMVDDPFFLERFGFMRYYFMRCDQMQFVLPQSLKDQSTQCLPCKQTFDNCRDFMKHIMDADHIKNKMTQEQLDLFITVHSLVLKKENGYEFSLQLSRKRSSENRDKIPVVLHKQSKKA